MSTKISDTGHASRNDDFSISSQIGQGLQRYFEMIPTDHPTLPEAWLAKTRLRSWPAASLAVAGGIYALFLILGFMDGTLAEIAKAKAWRDSLILSAMIAYLLLIQPILRRLLTNGVDTFLPLVPATKQRQKLVDRAYSLRRGQEWAAVGLAMLVGWGLDPPWAVPQGNLNLAPFVYRLIGGGLVFGLTGWHIYSAFIRTKVLAELHRQAEQVNIFKQNAPFTPIVNWSLGVIGALIGGIVVSAIFINPDDIQSLTVVFTYSATVVVAALMLVFRRAPASLLSRIGMFRAVFLFTVVVAIGTFGFIYLEEWNIEQALYTTVITMTTVGYGDLTPSNTASRFFAIGLSLVAVGIAGYAVSSVAAFIVEGNLGRLLRGKKVYKLIGKLNHHIIVCGAGQVGKQIALELYKTRTPFVMVEQDPMVLDELLREVEFPFIEGNATHDQVLTLAGIERAKGLITALHNDKDNAFVVLSARELAQKLNNPNLRIISRVDNEKQRRKLQQAGADTMISPKAVGGRRMAGMMLYPQIYIFIDEMVHAEQQTGQTLRLEEVYVDKINHPALMEKLEQDELTVASVGQHTGLLVVAIKRNNNNQADPYLYTPRGHTRLKIDDILIVLGTPEERASLRDEGLPGGLDILRSKAAEIWDKWEQVFVREDEL